MSKLFTFDPKTLKTKFTYYIRPNEKDGVIDLSDLYNEETLFEKFGGIDAKYSSHNKSTTEGIIDLLGLDSSLVANIKNSTTSLINTLVGVDKLIVEDKNELVIEYSPKLEIKIANEYGEKSFIPANQIVVEGDILLFADDVYFSKELDGLFHFGVYKLTLNLTIVKISSNTEMVIKSLQ